MTRKNTKQKTETKTETALSRRSLEQIRGGSTYLKWKKQC